MNDLERIASELCVNDGHYPSAPIFPFPLAQGKDGRWIAPDPNWTNKPIPQWTLYADYVRATLSMVLEAAGPGDVRETINDILKERDDPIENDEISTEIDKPPVTGWRRQYGLD
ncbi:MAG TPA: hypothetical protein VGN16_09335 [Acidobacteriaceae bacterium]|jgi:hypothetical protein